MREGMMRLGTQTLRLAYQRHIGSFHENVLGIEQEKMSRAFQSLYWR